MKMFLWFVSTSMTFAFVDVAYLHKTPPEALTLGLLVGATSVAMNWGVFARIRRRLGWPS